MTELDQIKAIAELDGRQINLTEDGDIIDEDSPPDYLHSLDAIVLVIRKQWLAQAFAPEKFYQAIPNYYPHILTFIQYTTAKELCEALLRATGKWKD